MKENICRRCGEPNCPKLLCIDCFKFVCMRKRIERYKSRSCLIKD